MKKTVFRTLLVALLTTAGAVLAPQPHSLSATTSAGTSKPVRFIFFCAADKCSGTKSTVDDIATRVHNFYKSEVGHGYPVATTVKVTGSHNAAWYGVCHKSSGCPGSRAENTIENLYNSSAVNKAGYYNVVELGFQSMDHCGIAYQPGTLAVGDPFYGCSGIQGSVLAHELGHSFGLSHVDINYNLMDVPLACSGAGLSGCNLNSTQKTHLRGMAEFN